MGLPFPVSKSGGMAVLVSFSFFYRQQDQSVFAQKVYYTSLKPTDAATLSG